MNNSYLFYTIVSFTYLFYQAAAAHSSALFFSQGYKALYLFTQYFLLCSSRSLLPLPSSRSFPPLLFNNRSTSYFITHYAPRYFFYMYFFIARKLPHPQTELDCLLVSRIRAILPTWILAWQTRATRPHLDLDNNESTFFFFNIYYYYYECW